LAGRRCTELCGVSVRAHQRRERVLPGCVVARDLRLKQLRRAAAGRVSHLGELGLLSGHHLLHTTGVRSVTPPRPTGWLAGWLERESGVPIEAGTGPRTAMLDLFSSRVSAHIWRCSSSNPDCARPPPRPPAHNEMRRRRNQADSANQHTQRSGQDRARGGGGAEAAATTLLSAHRQLALLHGGLL
jgi:hypothetical protein